MAPAVEALAAAVAARLAGASGFGLGEGGVADGAFVGGERMAYDETVGVVFHRYIIERMFWLSRGLALSEV
jgi:hypothetical protein